MKKSRADGSCSLNWAFLSTQMHNWWSRTNSNHQNILETSLRSRSVPHTICGDVTSNKYVLIVNAKNDLEDRNKLRCMVQSTINQNLANNGVTKEWQKETETMFFFNYQLSRDSCQLLRKCREFRLICIHRQKFWLIWLNREIPLTIKYSYWPSIHLFSFISSLFWPFLPSPVPFLLFFDTFW